MRIRYAAKTDQGLKRNHNEDYFCLIEEEQLFLVADGMGGHACGEVASQMAADVIRGRISGLRHDLLHVQIGIPGGLGINVEVEDIVAPVQAARAQRDVIHHAVDAQRSHESEIVEGTLDASPSRDHEILINVRALADPAELQAIIECEFARLPARLAWKHVQCFRPAAPVPYHRTS